MPKAVGRLASRDNVREVVLISTCNRTEVYAVTERFHGAYADIRDFLCEIGDISPDELHPHLYSHHDDAAVRHLFEVAAGLDSAVVGESEILGQVRQAWEIAQLEGGARATMNLLFRHALVVGKRARTETGIGRGTTSVSQAAVEMAADHLGGLDGRQVAVVGAGAMGEGIAVALPAGGRPGVRRQPHARARRRAGATSRRHGARARPPRTKCWSTSDVVITSTGAGRPLVTAELARLADRAHAAGRPLLLVDIAVPRDVGAEVREVPGVAVLDIDDLSAWAERGMALRQAEVEHVAAIVAEEVDRFVGRRRRHCRRRRWSARCASGPRRSRLDELRRYRPPAGAISTTNSASWSRRSPAGVIAKLLHEPSVRLREQAGSPRGERNAAAVADLFDLG